MFLLQLNSAWDSLNKAWKDRVERLEEAMQAAVQYQDGLQVRGLQCVCWERESCQLLSAEYTLASPQSCKGACRLLACFSSCLPLGGTSVTRSRCRLMYTFKCVFIHTFSEISFEKKYFNFFKLREIFPHGVFLNGLAPDTETKLNLSSVLKSSG